MMVVNCGKNVARRHMCTNWSRYMKQQMHISTASLLDHNIMTVDTKVLVELKYSTCDFEKFSALWYRSNYKCMCHWQ